MLSVLQNLIFILYKKNLLNICDKKLNQNILRERNYAEDRVKQSTEVQKLLVIQNWTRKWGVINNFALISKEYVYLFYDYIFYIYVNKKYDLRCFTPIKIC